MPRSKLCLSSRKGISERTVWLKISLPAFDAHKHCLQAGGSASADELLPGSAGNARTDEDSGGEAADEAGNEGEGQKGRPRTPRDGAQLGPKAKHRLRRLKELQAEQELHASLGSSTGELTVPSACSCSRLH